MSLYSALAFYAMELQTKKGLHSEPGLSDSGKEAGGRKCVSADETTKQFLVIVEGSEEPYAVVDILGRVHNRGVGVDFCDGADRTICCSGVLR